MMKKGEQVGLWFRDNVGFLIIFITCGAYLLYGLVTIDETGKTVAQIVGDTAVAFLLGFSINRLFEKQGVMSGEKDERVRATDKLHSDTVMGIADIIDQFDDYAKTENARALKVARVATLLDEGLKYDKYFDDDGIYVDSSIPDCVSWFKWKKTETEKRNRIIRKTVKRAMKVKITPLSSNSVTSEGGKHLDPFNFGPTVKQYLTKSSLGDIVYKLITAGVFGYYGIKFIEEFKWALLIWTGIQVVIFLVGGITKYFSAFFFIVDDMRAKKIKKIDNLQKFKNARGGILHGAQLR